MQRPYGGTEHDVFKKLKGYHSWNMVREGVLSSGECSTSLEFHLKKDHSGCSRKIDLKENRMDGIDKVQAVPQVQEKEENNLNETGDSKNGKETNSRDSQEVNSQNSALDWLWRNVKEGSTVLGHLAFKTGEMVSFSEVMKKV